MVERMPWEHKVAGSNPVIPTINQFRSSSVVEQMAVNYLVTGSIPVFGAKFFRYVSYIRN